MVAPVTASRKIACSDAESEPFIFCHDSGQESAMTSSQVCPPELITGQRMTLEEFLSRWEALPEIKNAELIEGIVYVGSPVSFEHGTLDTLTHWLLAH